MDVAVAVGLAQDFVIVQDEMRFVVTKRRHARLHDERNLVGTHAEVVVLF